MEQRGLVFCLWGIQCPPEPQDTPNPIAHWAVRHLPMELEKVYVTLDARHGVRGYALWLLQDPCCAWHESFSQTWETLITDFNICMGGNVPGHPSVIPD